MREHMKIVFREEGVSQKIQEIANQISRSYGNTPLHLICILKGNAMFMCGFVRWLTVPASFDSMSVSSYNGTEPSGVVQIIKGLDESFENKHVLIVKDIVGTGRTLTYLIEALEERGPKDIHLCTLFNKPKRHVKKQVTVDHVCFTIPDRSMVGYGLDYGQRYRNYPYIGVVEFEDDKA